ncbi:hypothetical protein [Algoriphagus machipongonensis]|uniref:Uncharacterized protein n=1 Tax=Algoriphagus machipongonensis TaxID=388413 RepID=A3HXR7_9BACT|nr:hypothetical protein [Algoriphagus machipongonensis]EAZ81390.1 hypothetical protein ALPR1_20178 [Algoriphagus machipongonensis]
MKTFNKLIGAFLLFTLNPLSGISQTTNDNEAGISTSNFQISIVPYLGTNGTRSGTTINDYSFNLFGGYSAGTNKLEMASLFNINRYDAKHVQLAGLFNQVGGKFNGVQLAGLVNSSLDSVQGLQGAGLVNFTATGLRGAQMAGLVNFSGQQAHGFQAAGLINFSGKEFNGFQGAGLGNFAIGDVHGTQAAGLINFTPKDLHGVQIAGILNFARNVHGSQIGLINYSDSTSGAPIGLISFVKSGYHKIELSTNENLPINFAFRTGTRSFYNIVMVGFRPEFTEFTTWAFGYGIGTSPRLGKKSFLNIELSSEQLNRGNVEALNMINRLHVGLDLQVAKKFGIFAGPTLNYRLYENNYDRHPDLFIYDGFKVISEGTYKYNSDLGGQLWWGFRAGLRFL